MDKKKISTICYIIAVIGFAIAGILNFLNGNNIYGIIYVALACTFFNLSIMQKK